MGSIGGLPQPGTALAFTFLPHFSRFIGLAAISMLAILLLACAPAPPKLILHERTEVTPDLVGLRLGLTTTTLYVEHVDWGMTLAVHLFSDPLNEDGYVDSLTGERFAPVWRFIPDEQGKRFELQWGQRLRAAGTVHVDGSTLDIRGEMECLERASRPIYLPITFVHPDWHMNPADVRLRPVGEWGEVTLQQVMPLLRPADEGRYPFDKLGDKRFLPFLRVSDSARQREVVIRPRWPQGFKLQERTLDVLLRTHGDAGQRVPFRVTLQFNQVGEHD